MEGKRAVTSVWLGDEDRERADRLIELGLADSLSEAMRTGLALALLAVDRLGVPMTARVR